MFTKRGFNVFTSIIPEAYDMVITSDHDGMNEMSTVQVKTLRYRHDREGQLVITGSTNDGIPYSKDVVDYILGVDVDNGVGYLVKNTELREYWATSHEAASNKWIKLTV